MTCTLGLMAPGIWYQMHQVVEGSLNVTGVVLPGAPYIVAGHNEDIAWGMTNVTVDDIDFYLETINPADSNQYMLDGEWKDMELVEEQIMVKGKDEPVIRINRFTHRGPVVSKFRGVDDQVLSLRWQGNEFSNELRTCHLLNRAGNWEDFRDAVNTFTSISQNIVYADRFGNIGLQTSAGVPIRNGGGILVYPGDTSLYDWIGLVPFEELPYSFQSRVRVCLQCQQPNGWMMIIPTTSGPGSACPTASKGSGRCLRSQREHGIEDFQENAEGSDLTFWQER